MAAGLGAAALAALAAQFDSSSSTNGLVPEHNANAPVGHDATQDSNNIAPHDGFGAPHGSEAPADVSAAHELEGMLAHDSALGGQLQDMSNANQSAEIEITDGIQ
jgi:hypothetical protein